VAVKPIITNRPPSPARAANSSSDGFCVAKEPVLSAPAGSYVGINMPPAVVRCSTSFIERWRAVAEEALAGGPM
jgi:hypothetical protein